MLPVAVIGGGAWGTALAIQLSRCGHEVRLWERHPEHAAEMQRTRYNETYLSGIPLPEEMVITASLEKALAGTRRVVLAVPSGAVAEVANSLAETMDRRSWLVCATKGLEERTGRLLHEVLQEDLAKHVAGIAILSGPSFAQEVAQGLPTALTVAAEDLAQAEEVADWLRCDPLRVYSGNDLVGVELGGAAKNVIAIAAGISDGLSLGHNARAALITRGLAEIMRLGSTYGARTETLAGLAGLGDLVLTCTGPLSRNHQLGERLGAGVAIQELPSSLWQRAEGVGTARALYRQAAGLGIEMPITEEVYRVLYGGGDPKQALFSLMQRKPKPEYDLGPKRNGG